MIVLTTKKAVFALAVLVFVPACGGGGGGGGAPAPDPIQSSFAANTSFGTRADGLAIVELSTVVADKKGTPLAGVEIEFRASGFGNVLVQPALTDENGVATGSIASTAAEAKTIRAIASPGAGERELGALVTEFVEILPNTYYVRANGSDAASGTAPLEAWRTLPYAITQVGAGDTLHVGAGNYEAIEITTVATATQPLIIRADREGTFTGDAGEVFIDAAGGTHGIKLDYAGYVTIRGFSIFGARPGLANGGGIWITFASSAYNSILECSIFENDRGIHVEMALGLLLEGNRVSKNMGDGIVFGYTVAANVLNNLIYANDGAGLVLADASTVLTVGLNTFYQNAGDQLEERVPGSDGDISDNVLSEGGSEAVSLAGTSSLFPTYNLIWGHGGAEQRPLPPDPNNVSGDPLFAAPYGNDGVLGGFGAWDDDFRTLENSAIADAGDRDARDLMLPYAGTVAGLTTRTDDLRDGESPDLDTVNLGYHSRAPIDDFTSAVEGGARLAYVLPERAIVRTATRSDDGRWTAPSSAHVANSEARWVVHRVAEGRPDELTAVLAETANEGQLFVRRWNGRRWTESSVPIATIQSQNVGERGFDIDYESQSGDALIVYSNNDSNPVFRTLVGGRLSEPAPVFASPLGTGTVLWVELVAEVGSDRVAMVALDDDQNLTATIWDGSTWTLPILLDTQIVEMREFRAFDAAWETLSGELLVVWGFSVFAERARIATLDADGNWGFSIHSSAEAISSIVRLESDPTSDRIVTAFGEGRQDDDVVVAMWNGDAYVQTAEVTLQGAFAQHSIDVGWIGNTGRAFATWRDQGGSGTFMRAHFDNTWKIESEVSVVGVGAAVQSEIRAVPGTDRAEAIVLDATGSLFQFGITWNGNQSVWTLENGGGAIDTGFDMMAPTKSFSFDVRRP